MSLETEHLLTDILHELRAIRAELCVRNGAAPAAEEAPAVATPAPEPPTPAGGEAAMPEAAIAWLQRRGIGVKCYADRDEQGADAALDELAIVMGQRYEQVVRLLDAIRRNLGTGSSFVLNLTTASQEEVAACAHLANMLSSYAFLTAYRYNRSTKTLSATPQRRGMAIGFLTGGWFERYVRLQASALLAQAGRPYTCMVNGQIEMPNGDGFELDLFYMVDGRPLWIECKTGDYQAYIARYADMRKVLGVPKANAVLALLEVSPNLARSLTGLYDMSVTNPAGLGQAIGYALEMPAESIPKAQPPATAVRVAGRLAAVLNKAGLRPLPEERPAIIQALIDLMAGLQEPATLAQLKPLLAERLAASRSQVQDVLNAIIRGGCALDANGEPVTSGAMPVARLISTDAVEIEARCLQSYARAALLHDAGYFAGAGSADEFERVTGGRVPSHMAATPADGEA
ncbi:MAG TPA: hypothetical protein PLJ35_19445 [Anaerolineae bacterium]|nr:hypothetical protein [Anaerolineae bacterium]HOR00996.1 hypothetical protein [Anaerolineae bacterium]